jgi:tryptophan-rich sensory protein
LDWIALFKTVGLCLISIVIEAMSVTKDGKNWFENLRQPKFSFPFSFWYVVGSLYYIICGVIAYRQFHFSSEWFSIPVGLLIVIMITNGLTNFILFKFRSLKMFYRVLLPFTALFVGLIVSLYNDDMISAGLAAVYLVWLSYDVYYFKKMHELNGG